MEILNIFPPNASISILALIIPHRKNTSIYEAYFPRMSMRVWKVGGMKILPYAHAHTRLVYEAT